MEITPYGSKNHLAHSNGGPLQQISFEYGNSDIHRKSCNQDLRYKYFMINVA